MKWETTDTKNIGFDFGDVYKRQLSGCGQMFSDIRTYWSPEAVKRVTGKELTVMAKNGIIHLINSGATTLDATGESHNEAGEPCMKPN